MKKKYVSLLVLAMLFSQYANADLLDYTQIVEKAESLTGIDISSALGIDTDSVSDVDSASEDSESNIFTTAQEYLDGALPDMDSLTNTLSDAMSAVSVSSTQKDPTSTTDDIVLSYTNNITDTCTEYKYLGLCWYIKTSLWPSIGTKNVAQNYVDDLQVEITSRIPANPSSNYFSPSDNAPTDSFSGAIIQNVASTVAKTFDSLFSASSGAPEMQFTENQEDKNNAQGSLFREAMVVGNPVESVVISPWELLPGYCSSSVTPYVTYYTSSLDLFSWRILATTDALLLSVYSIDYMSWNEVGKNMGSVFPRMGYTESKDEMDAAVTTAYRAISIVSDRRTQYKGEVGLHIATPTDEYASGSRSNQSDYKFRTKRDHKTQLLRMYFPTDSDTCRNYRSASQLSKQTLNTKFNSSNRAHSAAFKVYRPFVCCKKKHSYLFTSALSPSFETY